MDIYITGNLPKSSKDTGTAVKLQLPVLPEKISVKKATRFTTYDIIGKGPVQVPSGEELNVYSWEAILPGAKNKNHPMVRNYIKADTVLKYFSTWKKYGCKLSLNITGMGINTKVYLDSIESDKSGPSGDYVYRISFVQAKEITVSVKNGKGNKKQSKKKETKNGTSDKNKVYTVKRGDCLWNISLKYYGKGILWKNIYQKNKNIIEATAKKYGHRSSGNGHWIFPGTKLVIP